jgi:aspartyl-tRNA(Asn)/glutamyl-tRNA(Gln) amidotransferase subunit A
MSSETALQLKNGILNGEIKPTAAVEDILVRVEKFDSTIGAYLSTFPELARKQAEKIETKLANGDKIGSLAGLPVAVKDNICTDFGKTTCASKILENFKSPYNATVIDKLLAEDAIIIGKTNLDEFAMGSSTENSALGKTVNPWDSERVPGGSSGGSVAAVAARLCFAALGSDTGGSIRQPASFCGVVGLKPTYGRISRYGLVAFGSSLDQIGPITRDVSDAALMMNAISGWDSADSTSVPSEYVPKIDYEKDIEKPLENLKVGVIPELASGADRNVLESVQKGIDFYKNNGAEIVELETPHLEYSVSCYYVVATAEASSNLSRYDGVRYGRRAENPEDLIQVYTKSRQEGFGDEVKRRIMLGTYALSSGYYDAYYLKALKVRNLIREDFKKAFEKCDCIITPVAPTTAFKIGQNVDDPLKMYLSDIYTLGVNLAGLPAVSIPAGFDEHNLPVGMQIITDYFREDKLLRIARMFEKENSFPDKIPASING